MQTLDGATAIITGAGRPAGIGRAVALKLASKGAAVAVTDLDGETESADGRISNRAALDGLVKEILAQGGSAIAATVDITDPAQIEACLAAVHETFGGVDILVNNAGTSAGALPFLEVTPAQWDASYQVNLKGVALFCQAVLPIMIDQQGGVIVNNASTAGLGAEPGFGAYTASKHALIGLTKTIAAEFGPDNIRCNAVCPGFTETDMHMAANKSIAEREGLALDAVKQRRYQGVSLRRAARPEEVADAIAYLASPAASYITGVALPVAGGCAVGL